MPLPLLPSQVGLIVRGRCSKSLVDGRQLPMIPPLTLLSLHHRILHRRRRRRLPPPSTNRHFPPPTRPRWKRPHHHCPDLFSALPRKEPFLMPTAMQKTACQIKTMTPLHCPNNNSNAILKRNSPSSPHHRQVATRCGAIKRRRNTTNSHIMIIITIIILFLTSYQFDHHCRRNYSMFQLRCFYDGTHQLGSSCGRSIC